MIVSDWCVICINSMEIGWTSYKEINSSMEGPLGRRRTIAYDTWFKVLHFATNVQELSVWFIRNIFLIYDK